MAFIAHMMTQIYNSVQQNIIDIWNMVMLIKDKQVIMILFGQELPQDQIKLFLLMPNKF